MSQSFSQSVALVAGIYLLWLSCWLVLGDRAFGPQFWNWDQALAALVSAIVAFSASRRAAKPYAAFLGAQSLSLMLLSFSWIMYDPDEKRHFMPIADTGLAFSDISYAVCVFIWVCAWGYLAAGLWQHYQPTALTRAVFATLFLGLAVILASFYYPEFHSFLDTTWGRLCAVTAALEFLALLIGVICILLKGESALNWLFLAIALLIACDMGYSEEHVPVGMNALWMFGQLLMPVSCLSFSAYRKKNGEESPASDTAGSFRSDLSGILMLLSLSGLLMSVFLGFMNIGFVWKSFFAVLFVVCLIVVQSRLMDRYDESVRYLGTYSRKLLRRHPDPSDWRSEQKGVSATLHSTGLGVYLDELSETARNLGKEVIFLGPERLYPELEQSIAPGRRSCFIVMPFGSEWSDDVHRILSGVCSSLNIRPIRGDDLFKPGDFLVDIWQSINNADIVIADISGKNPNVLYELGIAHTIGKPVLIISRSAGDIPIDLSTRRVVIYGQKEERWREELESRVKTAVQEMIRVYFQDV